MQADTSQRSNPLVECDCHECNAMKWAGDMRDTDRVDGRFCSSKCETRHLGFQTLKSVQYDHCVCFSCFRTIKTVEEPKPADEFDTDGHGWTINPETGNPTLEYFSQEVTLTAACGFQHLTPNAGKGEKQHGERVITGTICRTCGNTDHKAHVRVLSDREAIGRLVTKLVEIDDDELEVSPETIHREYSGGEPLNIAVGRAVQ